MGISILTVKIFIGLLVLFAITKILGKTQISQITPFDFISSIVMGELFVHGVFQANFDLLSLVYPLLLWGVFVYIFELLGAKFLKLRSFIEGNPSIIIRHGKIDRRQMGRNKINLNQLLNLLRQKDVFSINEVEFAILEMNGTLSVLKKSPDAAPSRKDFQLPEQPVYLPITLISDGKVLINNLQEAGLNPAGLNELLKNQGVSNIKDVFYAEWRADQGLAISLK